MDFSSIDLFGSQIGLRYLNQEQYKTHFGTWVSLVIGVLICIQAVISSQELFAKQNPEVISAERYVASPERFYLKKDNFNFAFGQQFPGNYSHYIDESIYKVFAKQVHMKKTYNEQTQTYDQEWTTTPLKVRPCNINNFEVQETKGYFQALQGFEQMYCLDQESNDIFFEGSFDQDQYGHVLLQFEMCKGSPNCRSPEEMKSILINSCAAMYSNDVIINSRNIDPFKIVGRDFFWNTSPIFPKEVMMSFRNVYVESDEGIFFEQKDFKKSTVHSTQSQEIIFSDSDFYLQIVLRFEKAKESIYHRKYKKLDSVLAEIGGIAKVLMVIGLFISMPINKLLFSQQLSNQLFHFKVVDNQQEEQKQQQKYLPTINVVNEEAKEMNCYVKKDASHQKSQETNKNSNTIRLDQLVSPIHQAFLQVEKQMESSSENKKRTKEVSNGVSLNIDKDNPSQLVDQQMEERQNKSFSNQVDSIKMQESQMFETPTGQKGKTISQSFPHQNSHFDQYLSQRKSSAQFEMNLSKFFDIQCELTETPQNAKKKSELISDSPMCTKNDQKTLKCDNNSNTKQRRLSKFGQQENETENEEESFKLQWSDYLKYYIWPFGEFKKKKQLIQYSTQKVYQHLDMVYIIQKLLELEKLKSILLDEDQISLIQFLPKPQINLNLLKPNLVNPNETLAKSKSINLLNNVVAINEKENAKAAFLALRNILKKTTLSNIDKNIIEMIDFSTLSNIQNNIEYLRSLIPDKNEQQEHQSSLSDGPELLLKEKSYLEKRDNFEEDIIMEIPCIDFKTDSQMSQNFPSCERGTNNQENAKQENSSIGIQKQNISQTDNLKVSDDQKPPI